MLTGESMSVGKSETIVFDSTAVKQDQTNMLFSGTTVVNGAARALAVLTGSRTAARCDPLEHQCDGRRGRKDSPENANSTTLETR